MLIYREGVGFDGQPMTATMGMTSRVVRISGVDGEQSELPVRGQRVQQAQKTRRGHALGRGVQQGELAGQ